MGSGRNEKRDRDEKRERELEVRREIEMRTEMELRRERGRGRENRRVQIGNVTAFYLQELFLNSQILKDLRETFYLPEVFFGKNQN